MPRVSQITAHSGRMEWDKRTKDSARSTQTVSKKLGSEPQVKSPFGGNFGTQRSLRYGVGAAGHRPESVLRDPKGLVPGTVQYCGSIANPVRAVKY